MVFEYSPEERQKLEEIEGRYGTLLLNIDTQIEKIKNRTEEIKQLIEKHEIDAEELERLINEWYAAKNAFTSENEALFDQAEKNRLDAFNGDVKAMAAEARRQADLVIKRRIYYDIILDGNLRKMIEELRTGNDSYKEPLRAEIKTKYRHTISFREARTLIYGNIKLIIEYLRENAPEEEKALERYITEYIRKSPYTYQKARTKSLADNNNEAAGTALQPIEKYELRLLKELSII